MCTVPQNSKLPYPMPPELTVGAVALPAIVGMVPCDTVALLETSTEAVTQVLSVLFLT